MIKVLFFIPNLAHGGAERVLTNLVNHMDYNQFDVTVQTMFDVGIYQEKLNKEVKYIGGFPWYFRGNIMAYKMFSPEFLFKHYIKGKYDIIVSYLEGTSARVIGGADCGQKSVCWIHIQLDEQKYAAHAFRNTDEMNRVYQSFDRIICVSDAVCQSFKKTIKVNVPTQVLYNTVEADVIRTMAEEAIDDITFDDKEINIISVAKLMKSKGYDRLVRVLKRLRENGIPAHVYIVGKGEERSNLEKLLKDNHVSEYWTFVGFKENPYKYVKNADLYVCSSRIEGFSTAVTEALIVGTPVVSTNCSGAYELLGAQNEYGIVTDNDENSLYEGIKQMVSTPEMLADYRQRAKLQGEKFSIKKTVQAVEDMLKEIAAQ